MRSTLPNESDPPQIAKWAIAKGDAALALRISKAENPPRVPQSNPGNLLVEERVARTGYAVELGLGLKDLLTILTTLWST